MFNIVEAQAPQPAIGREARGRYEVKIILTSLARIPRAVFGALQPRHAARY
jgi:hypothetical protein